MNIPKSHRDLLEDETRAFLFLATSMPDGSPQVTPVWFSMEGDYILINTNEGRVKDRNMKARSKVAMVIQDPSDPYRYVQIRGKVVTKTREGGDEHINQLSMIYRGKPWDVQPDQKRIIYKVKATSINAH